METLRPNVYLHLIISEVCSSESGVVFNEAIHQNKWRLILLFYGTARTVWAVEMAASPTAVPLQMKHAYFWLLGNLGLQLWFSWLVISGHWRTKSSSGFTFKTPMARSPTITKSSFCQLDSPIYQGSVTPPIDLVMVKLEFWWEAGHNSFRNIISRHVIQLVQYFSL